jgi:hypothetical protein
MRKHFTKKRTFVLAALFVILLGAASVGYAYWTAGGSGTGTASAAAGTSNVVVNQTTVLNPMYPGDSAQTISGNFDNPNPGSVYVTTVTASIASVTKGGSAPPGTCDASDFTLANPTATVNAEIPAGNAKGAWTGPTLHFNDKVTIQDACKGATVNLAYSIP